MSAHTMNSATTTSIASPWKSVWQPRQPAFWMLLVGIAIGLFMVGSQLIRVPESISITLMASAACIIQGIFFWFIAQWIPRVRLIPQPVQIIAILAGGGFGILVAGELSYALDTPLAGFGLANFSAAISAPLVEDATRMACVILVLGLIAGRRITAVDGVVIGFLVGTGFEIFENLFYALSAENATGALTMMINRTAVGFGLHVMWTAVAAGSVAYVWGRLQQKQRSHWWIIIPAYLAPMLLHAAWDSPGTTSLLFFRIFEYFLWYGISLALFLLATKFSRRDEWRAYASSVPLKQWRNMSRSDRLARSMLIR